MGRDVSIFQLSSIWIDSEGLSQCIDGEGRLGFVYISEDSQGILLLLLCNPL